ncbi:MAG: element excision factor XisI family protein [Chloroflexota bacterium]|nr:element excision factor XisI family protein [Chloroflexota bacterium]
MQTDHDSVVIERDMNDKPLVDALVQAGVPREKIILAYAGEAMPV